MRARAILSAVFLAVFLSVGAHPALAQARGAIEGRVTLAGTGEALHHATLLVAPLGLTTESDEQGNFSFRNIPAGTYSVVARMPGLSDLRQQVQVVAGQTARAEFNMRIEPLRQQVTVTASGREETTLEAFQAVTTLESLQLVERAQPSLGEVLEHQPGVAKRDFGPGSARPVLRGFDGDRVLIMKDGISTGSLSSQSADHGEPIDVLSLERLEVVKGPATLLYGSQAIGGVVNAVSPQEHMGRHLHEGLKGYVSGVGGTNSGQAGGGAGFEYGVGNWSLWANGSGQRTGEYHTPIGEIHNSQSRVNSLFGGFGWYGARPFFTFSVGQDRSRHGVPFAGEFHHQHDDDDDHDDDHSPLADEDDHDVDIALRSRRNNLRFSTGMRNLTGAIANFRLTFDVADYRHDELEVEHEGAEKIATRFHNRQYTYRATFEQQRAGRLSGTFGFTGRHRDYDVRGEEALAPPVVQNMIAFFALQEVNLEPVRLQFGARVENNRYDAQGLRDRSFTGFSGAAGVHIPVWHGTALVANYTHSYRAPALEELYNRGPHVGNLTFEIGNPDLRRERSDGVDLSLRHENGRFRGQVNFFHYRISDFVFLAPTGDIHDGLIEAEYLQANTRHTGAEAFTEIPVHRNLWLNLGLDVVNAELTEGVTSEETGLVTPAGTPLPRIPPVRGRAGLDFRYRGFSLRPQVLMASSAERIFPTETRTGGYAVFNLGASYTHASAHAVHVFSVNAFNLGDKLYRNHLSFIKDLAPEIGRGVRFGYTLRFF